MKEKMIKIALVGPNFFSYAESIRDEFNKRGIESSFYDERHKNSIFVKIIYRIKMDWVVKNKKRDHCKTIIDSIINNGYTDVLLISPQIISKEQVIALKSEGIRVHLYMWDSSKNHGKFLEYLNELYSRSSFDLNDCHDFHMKYIHLFAEDLFSSLSMEDKKREIDISFCGTMHSDRSAYLHEMLKIAYKKGLKVYLLLFFHSKILFLIKSFVRPANFYFFDKISTINFSRKRIADSMFKSKFVLDIPHKKQSGLTMRTFEALRSGAYLITLNNNTYTLPLNIQSRIIRLKKIDEIKSINFLDRSRKFSINKEQDYYLSVSRFVDNILDTMGCFEECLTKKDD